MKIYTKFILLCLFLFFVLNMRSKADSINPQKELEMTLNQLDTSISSQHLVYPEDQQFDSLRLGKVLYDALLSVVDVNTKSKKGYTALDYVAIWGKEFDNSVEVATLLLKKGADVNAKTNSGRTPLHIAARLNEVQLLKLLIEYKADINSLDTNNETPLHLATENKSEDAITILLLKGAKKNIKDKDGFTPLMVAAKYNEKNVASLLLLNEVKASEINDAMHIAADYDAYEVALVLINTGVKVDQKRGWTSLHTASYHDALDIATLLIEKEGADVNSKSEKFKDKYNYYYKNGDLPFFGGFCTPLMIAAMGSNLYDSAAIKIVTGVSVNNCAGCHGMIPLLIKKGADINARDQDGRTALYYCVDFPKGRSTYEDVNILLKAGAGVNYKSINGKTPLSAICQAYWSGTGDQKQDSMTVSLMIDKGANINTIDTAGNTPLMEALEVNGDYLGLTQMLLKKGAKVNMKNNNGLSALSFAVKNNRLKAAELLLKNGATMELKEKGGQTLLDDAYSDAMRNLLRHYGATD